MKGVFEVTCDATTRVPGSATAPRAICHFPNQQRGLAYLLYQMMCAPGLFRSVANRPSVRSARERMRETVRGPMTDRPLVEP